MEDCKLLNCDTIILCGLFSGGPYPLDHVQLLGVEHHWLVPHKGLKIAKL